MKKSYSIFLALIICLTVAFVVFARKPKTENIIRAYITSTDPIERLKYCYLGNITEEEFLNHYFGAKFGSKIKRIKKINELVYSADWITSDGVFATCKYYLIKQNGKWLINWPQSIGYNNISLGSFSAMTPDETKAFWVMAEVHNYYNFGIKNKKAVQSISIEDPARGGSFTGYILRELPCAKKLLKYLTGQKKITVVLAYPVGIESDGQFFIITWKPGYVIFSKEEIKQAEKEWAITFEYAYEQSRH